MALDAEKIDHFYASKLLDTFVNFLARKTDFFAGREDGEWEKNLYKKVHCILNQLTPQRFGTVLNEMKALPIDTIERLQGVIDLVFEKAVNEPNFSEPCALMCRELAFMQVPIAVGSKEFVNLRKLLVTRCQMEFEKLSSEESSRIVRLNEIETCPDPERKKELLSALDNNDRRNRILSMGTIRFMGELFKKQMLTKNIMVRCLYNLIEDEDDDKVECLSVLLLTVGKHLDQEGVDLSKIIDQMRNIVVIKNDTVSNRVRFKLLDVIDLRARGWKQIQKEAENEQPGKLKIQQPNIDEFPNWRRGSNIKTAASNVNKYSLLEASNDMDNDNRLRCSSLERGYNKSYDGRNSRSRSLHRQ